MTVLETGKTLNEVFRPMIYDVFQAHFEALALKELDGFRGSTQETIDLLAQRHKNREQKERPEQTSECL